MSRTDTERLEWLMQQCCEVNWVSQNPYMNFTIRFVSPGKKGMPKQNISAMVRSAIDAAMDGNKAP